MRGQASFKPVSILEKGAVIDYAGTDLVQIDRHVLPTGFSDWDSA